VQNHSILDFGLRILDRKDLRIVIVPLPHFHHHPLTGDPSRVPVTGGNSLQFITKLYYYA
jgi:hypothetical protein